MAYIRKIKRSIHAVVNQLLFYNGKQAAMHDYQKSFLQAQRDIRELIECPLSDAEILVLGCGYHYPDVGLFSNISKRVVGIDTLGAFYKDNLGKTFRDFRDNGADAASALVKAMLLKNNYRRFYRNLEKISGVRINHQKLDLISYNGYQMRLEDKSFDVVLSNAVLEHVEDLERLVPELYRVTKKQGISYHLWHNYYSFSGGHLRKSLCLKHPWGHLRGKYETSGLNKLSPTEIHDIYSRYFDIIALHQVDKDHRKNENGSGFQSEREDLLSESIRNEIGTFPRELLLTRSYLIIGRRKHNS